jgi:hypothetical protein
VRQERKTRRRWGFVAEWKRLCDALQQIEDGLPYESVYRDTLGTSALLELRPHGWR